MTTSELSRQQRSRGSLRPGILKVGTASFKDSSEIPARAPGQTDAQWEMSWAALWVGSSALSDPQAHREARRYLHGCCGATKASSPFQACCG